MFLFSLSCKCGLKTTVRLNMFSTAMSAYCPSCQQEADITFLQKEQDYEYEYSRGA